MKKLLLLVLSTVALFGEFEVSGHLDLNSQLYLTSPSDKHSYNLTAKQTFEFLYTHEKLTAFAKLYAQEDSYDFLDKKDHNDRTFVRVDELFLKYDFIDDSITAGKSIKFWGALELRNIVDGFNPDDFRSDMFDPDKLGAWNLTYSHYTESGEFSMIVKLHEQNQVMPGYPYVYYFLPKNIEYIDTLASSDGEYRPSLYLMYNGSTDTEYALDYAFIYENGYDSQRFFKTDATAFTPPTEFQQNTYLVNKFMTYNTLVINATLIKLEALYAKVDENKFVGDYSHIAFGVEHSLDDFENGATLGLIAEYYSYATYEDDKYNDLELFETMQNDIFLGLRYTLNNDNDTAIVGGVVADFEYQEETYYAQFESRVFDDYKVAFDYYYINPSTTRNTAYALLGTHQRVALNIAWHF